jgi:hypothetical protein
MRFVIYLSILSFALSQAAMAEIDVAEEHPMEGTPVEVTVTSSEGIPVANAVVTAMFRPGSEVTSENTAGTTDASGRFSWTPSQAGLVTLSAVAPSTGDDGETLSSTLSVRYSSPPPLGVLMMILSGSILYGGVIYGFRKLNDEPSFDFPPDT